jgi:anti-anti-sigma factor
MLKVFAEKFEDTAILHLRGSITNGAATSNLREAVYSLAEIKSLVLDLSEVKLIDAGGFGVLLEIRHWAESTNADLKLTGLSHRVRGLFELTCLDSVFEISTDKGVHSVMHYACC